MSTPEVVKLLPRNATALRKTQDSTRAPRLVAGNSVATRLESGVGNCFPGLECDLRNLERRFFPFLEFDLIGNFIVLASVEEDGVHRALSAGGLTPSEVSNFDALAEDLRAGRRVLVARLAGTFGVLG